MCASIKIKEINNNMHGFVLDKHSACCCVHFVIVSLHISAVLASLVCVVFDFFFGCMFSVLFTLLNIFCIFAFVYSMVYTELTTDHS